MKKPTRRKGTFRLWTLGLCSFGDIFKRVEAGPFYWPREEEISDLPNPFVMPRTRPFPNRKIYSVSTNPPQNLNFQRKSIDPVRTYLNDGERLKAFRGQGPLGVPWEETVIKNGVQCGKSTRWAESSPEQIIWDIYNGILTFDPKYLQYFESLPDKYRGMEEC